MSPGRGWRRCAALVACAIGGAGQVSAQAVYCPQALGATANDPGDDDTPGIQAAIDAAIDFANASGQEAVVQLQGGAEYLLRTGKRGRGHLDLSCIEFGSVRFDGQGAKIVVETPRLGVFFAERSDGLVIENVEIDLEPLPHLGARILSVAVEDRVVMAEPLTGSTPLALFPGYSDEWGWLHDEDVWHRPMRGVADSFRAQERRQLEDGRLRFVMDRGARMADFAVGALMSFHYRRGNNFRLQLCENVELRNVVSYGAGLFFVSTSHVSGLTVDRCAVLALPGRVQATGGDGVHVKYGRDVVVRSCYFEGLADDAVNLSGTIGFRVEDCEFVSKRRHGIVFDTDGVPYRSRDGALLRNHVAHNGGSLLYHDGGDYSSVLVASNRGWGNNRSLAVEEARVGELWTLDAGGQGAAQPAPRPSRALSWLGPAAGRPSSVVLGGDPKAGSPRWRMIRLATPRGHRVRLEALPLDANAALPWLYLTASDEGLGVAPSVRSWSPRSERRGGLDPQSWIQEKTGPAAFRLRHEVSGRYLVLEGASLALGPAEAAQLWGFRPQN